MGSVLKYNKIFNNLILIPIRIGIGLFICIDILALLFYLIKSQLN
jgi:hypothetical protein